MAVADPSVRPCRKGADVTIRVLGLCLTGSGGMQFSYDPALVALSYAIAALGSFATLDMAERLRDPRRHAWLWLSGCAVTLGGSIWAMHFVGMLAILSPVPLRFDPRNTAASMAIAVAAAWVGFRIISLRRPGWARLLGAGGVLGAGVVVMHYVGMAGVRLPGTVTYTPGLFVLSVLIGMVAATLALALALMRTSPWQRVLAALAMATAVCGMHYAGMVAMVVHVTSSPLAVPGIRAGVLGATVTTVAFALLTLAIVSSGADRRIAVVIGHEVRMLREANALLERTQREIVRRLCIVGECHDDNTGQHVARIGVLAYRLARARGCHETFARDLMAAAPLHDIGKIGVPDAILHKPGRLTPEERLEMQQHARRGAGILRGSGLPLLDLAAEIAGTHHEKWDGSGYPDGLAGAAIPLSGRIVAIADVFDALLSPRPYKEPWSPARVKAFLGQEAGKRFEPGLVALFLADFDAMLALRATEDPLVADPTLLAGGPPDRLASAGMPEWPANAEASLVARLAM